MAELVEVRSLAPFSPRRSCEYVHSVRLLFSEGESREGGVGLLLSEVFREVGGGEETIRCVYSSNQQS